MSTEEDWDEIERSNGSVLCKRFLKHGKCSSKPCLWEHIADPGRDKPRPFCHNNLYRKGGCPDGQYCSLSHERPDGMGITQTPTSEPAKEARSNDRQNPNPRSNVSQPPRNGVFPRVSNGNNFRASTQINHNPSYNGVSQSRQDWIQQKGAVVGSVGEKFRLGDPGVGGARSMPNMLNGPKDRGVSLGNSSSNGHSGSPQFGHPKNTRGIQYRNPVDIAPTNGRINSAPRNFVPPHQEYPDSQNYQTKPSNGQRNHPPWNSNQSSRDEGAVNGRQSYDSNSGYRDKPNGTSQTRNVNANYAQLPFDSRGPFNGQARVMADDPKYPTFPSRQQEARFSTTHNNGIRGFPKNPYHSNTPQMHNRGNYRIQGNFNSASSVPPGDPGGSGSGQNSRLNVEDTISSIPVPEPVEPKLKGGGVALNNLPRVGNATKNQNELGAFDPPVTVVTGIVEKDTNSNRINPVKTSGHSNPIFPVPATIMPRNGIIDGEVITSMFADALKMKGRPGARSGIKSPENLRTRSTEEYDKLMEENHIINSNLEVIPAESAGNQLATNQKMDLATPVEVVPEEAKNSGLGETENMEGGAKIGDTEHGEHEEGGAKLPVEHSIQPEPTHSQNKIGLAEGNQSVSNGVANPLQGIRPPIGPKNWKPSARDLSRQNRYSSSNRVLEGHDRPNYVAQSRDGDNFGRAPGWGTQNTNRSKSESTQQLGPGMGEARSPDELIPQLYKSVYRPGMAPTSKDVTPTNPQPTIHTLSSTNFPPNTTQERPRESQFPHDAAFVNQGRDSILLQSNRHPEISRTPIFHPNNSIYMSSRDPSPRTLFSYSGSSVQLQANRYDIEPNVYNPEPETEPNRAYTPEPELEPDITSSTSESESDLNASRDYHEKMRIEAKASSMNRGVWGDKTPPNRPGSVEFEDFKEDPPAKDDTRENNLALAARLQKPGQFSKPPQAEQLLEKETQPIMKEPPKKKAHPTVAQPPKDGARPVSKDPPKKTVPPIAIKSLKEEARPRSADPPKKTVPAIALQSPKGEARPISGDHPKRIVPPTVERPIKGETQPAAKELPRKVASLVVDKIFERKIPSAWTAPLIKIAPPKATQEICWLCKFHHQRDGDCKADPKAIEARKSESRWASMIDRSDDWGYRGDENINGWSDDDSGVAIPESKKSSPAKPKRASKGPRPIKDSQNQDKNVVEEEATEPTKATSKGRRRRKERTPKEPRTNGKAEKKQPASEDSPGASKTDGPRSMMFRTNSNHFGKYYDTEIGGIRKLSEDTLHMIFSYVADGLMPEDQMKMKNVHIGSNFRLDASFTTTRYRRLKSVILSCRYWRNLCQHIVYKYVNLDQFGSFKRFAHTISEDPELGRMVHAIKINIQGGASYTTHDNRPSRQELSEMPKSSDSAQLFTLMMENCPELQILSVNMYGAIRGFNFVFTKFPKMREMQIMDDSSKGMVADNLWKSLDNYPNLEKFKIFHSEENGSMNFDSLKIPPKNILSKGSTAMALKALTMERAPELSDKILGVFASRLKQLTHLVIVDCKLVTSAGLARAIQRMPNASQLNRLIYYVWVDPFGKATQQEMAPQKDHLCSAIREHCTGLTYLNWKPYRICGDFWKGSNFRLLKRCRIEPMVFKDCNKEVELRNHSKFMDAYRQAREQERLPELAEDRAVFDFYF